MHICVKTNIIRYIPQGEISMPEYEQLSLFLSNERERQKILGKAEILDSVPISEKVLNGFSIMSIPFIGCDFDSVYPFLAKIIPRERTAFDCFPLQTAIIAEMVCASICHQINWDFLRNVVYNKTITSMNWLSPNYLATISTSEVYEMLSSYSKPERIRKDERTRILRNLGEWLGNYNSADQVFLNQAGLLLEQHIVRDNLLKCDVFSSDPGEKKMQLLFQKLSLFDKLAGLSNYCRPAIDYHLVRVYLRRGLLIAKNKYAMDFMENFDIERKESTMAAIRKLCSNLLLEICEYTQLNTNIVNQIEWQIGRSVCTQGVPDCFLLSQDAQWLKMSFNTCPFFNTCAARSNEKYLNLNEPTYKGKSY
jgi:hypothetical protein